MFTRLLTRLLTGLLTVLLMVTAGCVAVPTSGPVEPVEQAQIDESEGVNIPTGPAPGSSPTAIVSDFLDAMEAYPVSTEVAAKFLTDEAAQRWRPDRATVVYDRRTTTDVSRGVVAVEVEAVVRLSSRGTYHAVARSGSTDRDVFSLGKVDGEWRITDPPDALYVRSYFFDRYFSQFDLYFLDPTESALIADPVFLPTGDQLPTQLVRGLLAGPTPWLGSQAVTALPTAARIEVSVPLRDDGVAEVQLSRPVADLSPEQQQVLSAQLVWTLRQVPGVEAVRITVDGTPLGVEGADELQAVDSWPQYNPSGPLSNPALYALDEHGSLTEVGGDGPVAGLWGSPGEDLIDFTISSYEQLVAGVDSSGQRLVEGPLSADDRSTIVRRRLTEGRLSDPHWDRTGLLWVLDHSRGRTSWVVVNDGTPRHVRVGQLGRTRVSHMAVSADGARVAALVRDWDGPVWGGGRIDGPCVVVARVVRRGDGQAVRGLDRAYALPMPGYDVTRLLDVDWFSPSNVVVLADVSTLPPQPLELAIDGSAVDRVQSGEGLLTELGGVTIASLGVDGAPTVVGSRSGNLSMASSEGRWEIVATDLVQPHYPS